MTDVFCYILRHSTKLGDLYIDAGFFLDFTHDSSGHGFVALHMSTRQFPAALRIFFQQDPFFRIQHNCATGEKIGLYIPRSILTVHPLSPLRFVHYTTSVPRPCSHLLSSRMIRIDPARMWHDSRKDEKEEWLS